MAEPSAQRDDGEWQDFNAFKGGTGRNIHLERVHVSAEEMSLLLDGISDPESALENAMSSYTCTDEIIKHFDEKLQSCFQNIDSKPDAVYPVRPISEDTTLKCDEIWNALTDNYSNVMPVDWNQSRVRSLHLSTLSLEDRPRMESVNLDLSDDEDLREQMDTHSIIVSCINEEPLLTAEQVIEEIEELMQDSPEMESEQKASHSDLSFVSQKSQRSHSRQIYEERVRLMSVVELNDELEDVETAIRGYSEELIQHLAMRDELEFEKEVKNSFISVLIDVQNRQKVHREMLKKKRKVKNVAGSEKLPSSYVTTVIPYERKDGPPSVQDLQIFTKILEAMRDDSDKVPSLLTDYILKGEGEGTPRTTSSTQGTSERQTTETRDMQPEGSEGATSSIPGPSETQTTETRDTQPEASEGTTNTTCSATTLPPADTSPSAIPDIQGAPIDPADWPARKVRTELVSRGPYQTSPDFTFPKRDDGRSCHYNHFYRKLVNGEKIKRSWLVYSRKKILCIAFAASSFHRKIITSLVVV
ncbi:fasciculation and elongation protein zeta-2 isoform X2 [Megalobrama amblycephala]|uniref:fasciculation and elongation protein zeta-2 isoform X2 n=1 Tax=Megalobrama amblycephala TaxID=75352 RepID=UPI0020146E57|nr:fasciculation and elongation protein zeta-2 isoform X2 [Megalobrama amblycephala]